MTLAFESKFVSCHDTIEGEILQVISDTFPSSSTEDGRKTPIISRNFDFPTLRRLSGTMDVITMEVQKPSL